MMMRRIASMAAVAITVAGLAIGGLPAQAGNKDIVDTAVGAGQFNTLAAGTVESLLKPENKAKLAAILTYHVVPGTVTAAEVTKLTEAKTVEGAPVKISSKDGKVMINDATVVSADVGASNGVIHVIDTVLMPPAN